MKNKFIKCIAEQGERKTARQSRSPDVEESEERQEEQMEKKASSKNPDQVQQDISSEIEALLQSETRKAKNKTFYLDIEVTQAVSRFAKENGVTESRLVNMLLRRDLGVGRD